MNRPSSLRKRPSSSSDDEGEGLGWRLLAALVAVPVFELSLFLGAYVVFPSHSVAYLLMAIPLWVHGVYVAAAAAVGLLFGFKGITWLLGHLFMTHHEDEQNKIVTFLLWGALLGLAFAASFLVE